MEHPTFLLNKILLSNHNVTALLQTGNNSAVSVICIPSGISLGWQQ